MDIYLKEIIKLFIERQVDTKQGLSDVKKDIVKKYQISYPSNISLLKKYREMVENNEIRKDLSLEKVLQVRPIRSLSGVTSISVLVSPNPKWGKRNKTCSFDCLFCPTQPDLPKSYLEKEPAVMRAIANDFDPQKQIKARIRALQSTGHTTDKIELIIIGGTWSYLPKRYRTWFVKRAYDACNDNNSKTLEECQKKNEIAKNRIIGITVETRSDFIIKKELLHMRKVGITRVELGVQSIYNRILDLNNRSEKIETTIKATKLLKDAGFKVGYHIMPNLYGSDLEIDVKMFKELFSNPNFRPDYLKIYPCVVVENSDLHKIWLEKKFIPYTDKELVYLLKTVKQLIPYYCRVIRVIRDVPGNYIIGGSKITNLNQVILDEMKKEGKRCLCIRCREIRDKYNLETKLKIYRQDFIASDAKEIFLSWEDESRENIYGFLRLRILNSKSNFLLTFFKNSAIIRDVHIYGKVQPIGEKEINSPQHIGLGKTLIKIAEEIAHNNNVNKMIIISGVGVRRYYQKLGYHLEKTYMIKNVK